MKYIPRITSIVNNEIYVMFEAMAKEDDRDPIQELSYLIKKELRERGYRLPDPNKHEVTDER